MRIGELANRASVSVRSLRYYEEQQILTADRSPSGQRTYPESAVDRVRLIQQLYAAGLTSKAIVELLPCVIDGNATPELLGRLTAEHERIEARIAELVITKDRLESVISGATDNLRTRQPCRAAVAS